MRVASISVLICALIGACDATVTVIGPPPNIDGVDDTNDDEETPDEQPDEQQPDEQQPDVDPPPLVCVRPTLTTSGLRFDGTAGVSMGAAPDLATEHFTLEAWIRRDGDGREASTGVGGIKHVPIVSKGRGESDGSNVDCNYAMGLVGDVLGLDFEDMATGANHPVIGTTAIERGRFTHVAATFDGNALRLYVDGHLDGERQDRAVPRFDSIQHFGIGASFNSTGARAGAFHGVIDEVRVYARALSEAELQAQMFSTSPDARALIGHFHLDSSDGAVTDSSGNDNHGAGTAAGFTSPAAPTDIGAAARVLAASALVDDDNETATLRVDTDAAGAVVRFYARPLTDDDDFTIVVLPDSQYYTRNKNNSTRPNDDDPSFFRAQTQWAVDHRDSDNVIGVFHVGDIVNNADRPEQWNRADSAISILESFSEPGYYQHGVPYGLAFGNHDQFPKDVPEATAEANAIFGAARYANRGYYGGNFNGDNDENWVRFKAGNLDVIVLSYQYNTAPNADVLAWGRRVFESHPRALGVVASHSIVSGGGGFSAQGRAIYDSLRDVDNVQLMASGHVSVDARRTDTFQGNVIHSMLSDFQRCFPDESDPNKPLVGEQSRTNGGDGYMRIWRFSPKEQKLHVRTFSPKRNAAYTDPRNHFSVNVDLVGAGTGDAIELGAVTAENGTASLPLPLLDDAYEWFAVVDTCNHETTSTLQLVTR